MLLRLSRLMTALISPFNGACMKISIVCASVMVSLVTINAVSRYVFHYSFASAEEMARFMMIWFTFLLFPTVQAKGQNVVVDFMVARFRYTRAGMCLAIVTEISIIMVFCFCLHHGILYIERAWDVISPGSQVRMGYVFLVLPFSFVMCIFCCVERLLRFIHYLIHTEQFPDLKDRELRDLGIEES